MVVVRHQPNSGTASKTVRGGFKTSTSSRRVMEGCTRTPPAPSRLIAAPGNWAALATENCARVDFRRLFTTATPLAEFLRDCGRSNHETKENVSEKAKAFGQSLEKPWPTRGVDSQAHFQMGSGQTNGIDYLIQGYVCRH